MTLHQNLLEKRSQLNWLRFEPTIVRLQATCAIHYAMKYLMKLIVDVNMHIKNLSLKEKSHAKISGDRSLVSQSQHLISIFI